MPDREIIFALEFPYKETLKSSELFFSSPLTMIRISVVEMDEGTLSKEYFYLSYKFNYIVSAVIIIISMTMILKIQIFIALPLHSVFYFFIRRSQQKIPLTVINFFT